MKLEPSDRARLDPRLEPPAFEEPWHAQLFALTHDLARRGRYTWGEWSARLAAELEAAARSGGPTDGSDYYGAWLSAFEQLLGDLDLASTVELEQLVDAWRRAYLRTSHGQPVELSSNYP